MNPADPKWLEILKASGWQTASLAVAFFMFWKLVRTGAIPSSHSPLWEALPALGFLICGMLTLFGMVDALIKAINPRSRIALWQRRRSEQKLTENYIPHMTESDKKIIGYLLHNNQKTFQAGMTGGFAAPLISKGIIQKDLQHGQIFDISEMPFFVPDHIWAVLERNRESFPYTPPERTTEPPPWQETYFDLPPNLGPVRK